MNGAEVAAASSDAFCSENIARQTVKSPVVEIPNKSTLMQHLNSPKNCVNVTIMF